MPTSLVSEVTLDCTVFTEFAEANSDVSISTVLICPKRNSVNVYLPYTWVPCRITSTAEDKEPTPPATPLVSEVNENF